MPIRLWSTTDADNDDADSASGITWPEGMAASQVNNSARAMMTQVKTWWDDVVGGSVYVPSGSVGGTADAITLTTGQTITAYAAGQRFRFPAAGANTGAVTVNVDTVSTKAVTDHNGDALTGGDWATGDDIEIAYNATDSAFRLVNPKVLPEATESVSGTLDKATDAEIRAATAGAHAVCAEDLESASAAVALTDAATVAVDWDAFIYATLEITANRALGNPTNGQPGTYRQILVDGDDTTDRTLTFGNQFGGDVPTLTDIDSGKAYLLTIFCKTSSQFLVRAVNGSDA